MSKKILSTKGPEQSVTPVKVQPVQAKSDSFTFDPFSPSQSTKPITDSSSFFDPFSSPSQPSSQSVPPPVADSFDVFSPGRPQPSQKPKFDLFDSEIQPSQSSSNNKPAPSIFDMFDNFPTNPPAAAQTATSFDLFTPSTTSQINPTPMLDLFGMVSNDSIQNQGSDPFHNNYDSLSYSASSGKLTSSDPFATSNSLNHHYISPSSTYDSNAPVLDSPQISFNYYGGGGPSSTADPFADTPQSEAINPFETDIYPVFTSSSSPSMDPFFLSS